jgi:hypothetical protein
MRDKVFYDTHCHALTLSDPSFLALLQTIRSRKLETLYAQLTSFEYLGTSFFNRGGQKLRNMLSVMENKPGDIFMLMEDDLCGKYAKTETEQALVRDGKLHLGGALYDKIVFVPLLIDFSRGSEYITDTYYDRYPVKRIEAQIFDVLIGIKAYRIARPRGMAEILPFLGISPQNHTVKSLEKFLQRWFQGYSGSRKSAEQVFRDMKGASVEEMSQSPFAGIKLYPPLGFDPWPEDAKKRATVEALYDFCSEKGIPITTHCDEGGFRLISLEKCWNYTSPRRYLPVFKKYPKLKLNFAHLGHTYALPFGAAKTMEWRSEIFAMMQEFPGVYGDFSFNGTSPEYYDGLLRALDALSGESREIVQGRILFGSDFMVNLVKVKSYAEYLRIFSESALSRAQKLAFVSKNPEKFLFSDQETP